MLKEVLAVIGVLVGLYGWCLAVTAKTSDNKINQMWSGRKEV